MLNISLRTAIRIPSAICSNLSQHAQYYTTEYWHMIYVAVKSYIIVYSLILKSFYMLPLHIRQINLFEWYRPKYVICSHSYQFITYLRFCNKIENNTVIMSDTELHLSKSSFGIAKGFCGETVLLIGRWNTKQMLYMSNWPVKKLPSTNCRGGDGISHFLATYSTSVESSCQDNWFALLWRLCNRKLRVLQDVIHRWIHLLSRGILQNISTSRYFTLFKTPSR